jgi:hypothetical protein
MGTDIHPVVEVRTNGVWQVYQPPERPYQWFRPDDPVTEFNTPTVRTLPDCFHARDYRKFAILGDVRNGSGFAGVEIFKPVVPISSSRGLPDDFSGVEQQYDEEKEEYDDGVDLGDHSVGWVTLRELLEYDWTETMENVGVVSERHFLDCLINKHDPTDYSGGISGGGIVTVSPQGYLALFGKTEGPFHHVKTGTRTYDPKVRYYVQMRWEESLSEATKHWREPMIEYLTALVPEGGTPDDVRLVFGFDS